MATPQSSARSRSSEKNLLKIKTTTLKEMKKAFLKDIERDGHSEIPREITCTHSTTHNSYKPSLFLPFLKERSHLGKLLNLVNIYIHNCNIIKNVLTLESIKNKR